MLAVVRPGGLQRWAGACDQGGMSLRAPRLEPRPALQHYVRHIRIVDSVRDARPYVRLPDGELELVVRVGANEAALHAVGTRLAPLHKPVQEGGRFQALAVRFKAGGAYPFFGVPVSELTNRLVDLERLWGADSEPLREALLCASTPEARVALLENALVSRLSGPALFEPASAASVRRALRILQESSVLPNVEGLAEQLGGSPRQLRRAFAAVTGLGPKEYLRIVRFQRALRRARQTPTPHWGTLAVELGYYDQAHLIAEFRALSGSTPGALVRGTTRTRGAASVAAVTP
jgi:AraC-like DNA-binding protein